MKPFEINPDRSERTGGTSSEISSCGGLPPEKYRGAAKKHSFVLTALSDCRPGTKQARFRPKTAAWIKPVLDLLTAPHGHIRIGDDARMSRPRLGLRPARVHGQSTCECPPVLHGVRLDGPERSIAPGAACTLGLRRIALRVADHVHGQRALQRRPPARAQSVCAHPRVTPARHAVASLQHRFALRVLACGPSAPLHEG